jgi:hypothetical protein
LNYTGDNQCPTETELVQTAKALRQEGAVASASPRKTLLRKALPELVGVADQEEAEDWVAMDNV